MLIKKTNKFNRISLTAILFVCIILIVKLPVHADEASEVRVVLPIEQSFNGDLKGDQIVCEYTFTCIDYDNPMPADSINNIYKFTLKDQEQLTLGPLIYTSPGIYTYQLKQSSVNKENEFKRDDKVYTIEVRVNWDADNHLHAMVIAENDIGSKAEILKFINSYLEEDPKPNPKPEPKPEPKPQPKPDDKNTPGDKNGNGDKASGVRTGDVSDTIPLICVGLLSLIAIIIVYRKKRA